jgi:hypothetical protein
MNYILESSKPKRIFFAFQVKIAPLLEALK